jgi:Uma2 family endonuclease
MKTITDIRELDTNGSYTYADYLTWQFRERVELILGKIFKMSPAPSSTHQQISVAISTSIFTFLKGKDCKVYAAPFDVVLPNITGILNTIVQPDITVVCDPKKITERGCEGVPDLIVEIVSKSSVTRDLHEKYGIYQQAGVREYWIVHPLDRSLVIFTLTEGKYQPSKPLTKGDIATSIVLPGFTLDLNELFVDLVEEVEEEYGAVNRM